MSTNTESKSIETQSFLGFEPYVDEAVAAAFLKFDERTLLRWARDGHIPAHPFGDGRRKRWRFKLSELDAWVLGNVTSPTTARRPCRGTGVQ